MIALISNIVHNVLVNVTFIGVFLAVYSITALTTGIYGKKGKDT